MRTKLKTRKNVGGRPEKPNKELFRQVTCVLKLDTIERLREGADSTKFGAFLQHHLDRYPPPTRAQYLALLNGTDYWTRVKRKRIPALMASGMSRQARKLAREQKRYQKLSPQERVWEDAIRESVTKALAHG